jgi:ABC-type nitrate/sulfonate/bicarbonate transport system ATPase subunit
LARLRLELHGGSGSKKHQLEEAADSSNRFGAGMAAAGCGNSALLRLIASLDRYSRGEIEIGGRPVIKLGLDAAH